MKSQQLSHMSWAELSWTWERFWNCVVQLRAVNSNQLKSHFTLPPPNCIKFLLKFINIIGKIILFCISICHNWGPGRIPDHWLKILSVLFFMNSTSENFKIRNIFKLKQKNYYYFRKKKPSSASYIFIIFMIHSLDLSHFQVKDCVL